MPAYVVRRTLPSVRPGALTGVLLLLVIMALALAAPLLSWHGPQDLAQLGGVDARLPPGSRDATGHVYWLGTDDQGRDMVSAILLGLRISLLVVAGASAGALVVGLVVGLGAALAGGKLEGLIMGIVDVQLSIPGILIAIVLLAVIGPGTANTIVALMAVQWAYYARTMRSAAVMEKRQPHIEAARGLALAPSRIVLRHLLPNCLPALRATASVQIACAIALEATLSFLGLGLPITQPSLGRLIANGFPYLAAGDYWISVIPGVALLIAILAVNLVGDQWRSAIDPRLHR